MKENSKLTMSSPVTMIPGCGKIRAEKLKSLGINTVAQLLRHFPRGYQNRGDVRSITDSPIGENASFVLTVTTPVASVRLRGGKTLAKCKATDGTKSCTLVFFNRTYLKDVLRTDYTFRFWGKMMIGKNGYELYPSAIEPIKERQGLKNFIPVYPLTAGITQTVISSMVTYALSALGEEAFDDILPGKVREAFGVCGLSEAIRCLHMPDSIEMIERGRSRFIAEELFIFALSVTMAKRGRSTLEGIRFDPEKSKLYDFTEALPFTLTRAQSKVISEIRRDITSGGAPMARLVSGDVGSGKTVCAQAAAYMAVRNGFQCAMMAPTEILARQHYNDFCGLFGKLGIECGYLSGSLTAAEKRKVYAALESGKLKFVVGTHALLSDDVVFSNLGLVITDEQHRFGVMQRAVLAKKSVRSPHVLVMSATPIPRTLALIMCGDLDISVIDELPPGRQKVDTLVVSEKHRKRMYGFLSEQIKAGRQVYIVCPSVEAQEEAEVKEGEFLYLGYSKDPEKLPKLKSAVEYEKVIKNEIFPMFSTAFLHGRMSGKEKDVVMQAFCSGKTDILVSTTVIEVGVNVPNATVMVVENAERFGLSQLHQLRGRVGRGAEKSYCILVSDASGEKALKRLEIMKTVSDGYKIAQYDLEMRGPGDFMVMSADSSRSARQHGELNFHFAGLCTDTLMLNKAFETAELVISDDPTLTNPENTGLKGVLGEFESAAAASMN